MKYRAFAVVTACLAAVFTLSAQSFEETSRMVAAENAKALSGRAARPVVVASKRVPRADFYLWYSHLADKTWDADGNWWRPGASEHFFTRRTPEGDLNIVCSSEIDSALWSAPKPPCEDMVSEGNETFPMVSPDGKRLYFSSDGLFGIGGYDLYCASFDPVTKQWGDVRNMGYPFNSPADDLLFCDTPDGKWSLFASNRDCGKDSVVIYVLQQENFIQEPVDAQQLQVLSRLAVTSPDDGYRFAKHSAAPAPDLAFEEEEEKFELGFKVSDTGAFAADNTLPQGIVYQIQLFVSSGKPSVKQLKGISPVYAIKQRSGKSIYAAGIFRNYEAAEAALPAARRAGFPSAFIIAFEDGKPVALSKARQKESSTKLLNEEVHIVK